MEVRMEKLELAVETLCGTGVLLTPLYVIYKFAIYVVS
jgi:hypothetical protein